MNQSQQSKPNRNVSNLSSNKGSSLENIDHSLQNDFTFYKIWLCIHLAVFAYLLGPILVRDLPSIGSTRILILGILGASEIFLQYILMLYAISKKSLSAANIGLRLIILNAVLLVFVLAFFAYITITDSVISQIAEYFHELKLIILGIVSVMTFAHIVFTLLGGMKVKSLLVSRENIQRRGQNKNE